MIGNLQSIAPLIEDVALRFQLNQYFAEVLPKRKKKCQKLIKKEQQLR